MIHLRGSNVDLTVQSRLDDGDGGEVLYLCTFENEGVLHNVTVNVDQCALVSTRPNYALDNL